MWHVIKIVLNIHICIKHFAPPTFINQSEWVRVFVSEAGTSKSYLNLRERKVHFFLALVLADTWWETCCKREHLGKGPGMGLSRKLPCAYHDQKVLVDSMLPFLCEDGHRTGSALKSFSKTSPSFEGKWLVWFHNIGAARLPTSSTCIVVRPRRCWAGIRALVFLRDPFLTVLLGSLGKLLPGNGCGLSHFSQGSGRIDEVELGKWYFFFFF